MTSPCTLHVRSALLGLFAAMTVAQVGNAARDAGRPPGAVVWSVDLSAALAEAKAAQRLVLVCFNMDGEQANERALQMYQSADFARAAANIICVLCSSDDHGDEQAPCSRFRGCTCREHQASEKQARRHFFGAMRDNIAPQHILLYPDGLVAWHAVYEVAPSEIYKAIAGADKMKVQPLAQRLRGQRAFLEQMRGRAEKDVPTAYLQIQARLAQTPAEHFADALQVFGKGVATRLLSDLEGFQRERALPLLRAGAKHSTKAVRDLALALAGKVEQRAEPAAPATPDAAPPALPPLTTPLTVLGPADDLGRVYWLGQDQTLEACRDQVTLLWFFLLDAPGLDREVASMNEFAAAHGGLGVRTLGLVSSLRPAEAVEKLAGLGCSFPVGAYASTNGRRFFDVEMFPSWVVLDPEASVVHRSRQDGQVFDWLAARQLAGRMATSPVYANRVGSARPAK